MYFTHSTSKLLLSQRHFLPLSLTLPLPRPLETQTSRFFSTPSNKHRAFPSSSSRSSSSSSSISASGFLEYSSSASSPSASSSFIPSTLSLSTSSSALASLRHLQNVSEEAEAWRGSALFGFSFPFSSSPSSEELLSRIPSIDITFDTSSTSSIKKSASLIIQHLFPLWKQHVEGGEGKSCQFSIEQFKDGITNTLYRVSFEVPTSESSSFCITKRSILMRVYGPGTEFIIDRQQEVLNMATLNETGLAAPLYGRFKNGLCYGYVPGTTCTPEDLKSSSKFPIIARALAKFHEVPPPRLPSFSSSSSSPSSSQGPLLFRTMRKWLLQVPSLESGGYGDSKKNLQFQETFSRNWIESELQSLELELNRLDSDLVFCHNDLLSANILFDAPRRKERSGGEEVLIEGDGSVGEAHFIDFEYGGENYRLFDIGNHFCEMMGFEVQSDKYPSLELQTQWLTIYREAVGPALDHFSVPELLGAVNKFSWAAHLYWAIWSLVQARYSEIDFDYIGYAALRLREYRMRRYGSLQ